MQINSGRTSHLRLNAAPVKMFSVNLRPAPTGRRLHLTFTYIGWLLTGRAQAHFEVSLNYC